LLTLYGLKKFEREMRRDTYYHLAVACRGCATAPTAIRQALKNHGLAILQFGVEKSMPENTVVFSFGLRHRGGLNTEKMVDEISAIPDIIDIKWK